MFFAGFRLGNPVIYLCADCSVSGSHALLLGIDIREAGKDRKGISSETATKAVTANCGDDVGDLFIRLKHAKITEGKPTRDGQVILHYDENDKIHRRSCGFIKRASGKAWFSWHDLCWDWLRLD